MSANRVRPGFPVVILSDYLGRGTRDVGALAMMLASTTLSLRRME